MERIVKSMFLSVDYIKGMNKDKLDYLEDEEAEQVSVVDFVKFTRSVESYDKSYKGVTLADILTCYSHFNALALAKIIQRRR